MRVRNKDNVIALIQKNRDTIRQYGVEAIGLFGSFVRNEQGEDSDTDLLVKFNLEEKTFANFMDLDDYLEAIFERQVEIVTPEYLNPYIGPTLLRETEYVSLAH